MTLLRRLPAALVATLAAAGRAARGCAGARRVAGSSPSAGAALGAAPGRVQLDFNEPVEGLLGAVRVFDAGAGGSTAAR